MNMKQLILFFSVICFVSCQKQTKNSVLVTVKNNLNFDRAFETVEIDLKNLQSLNATEFAVIHKQSRDTLASQTIDYDLDGKVDVLLFQPKVNANSKEAYEIIASFKKETEALCYSRFVPERTDDYAWENNKVAFRTYGPTAQQMVENNIKGGTLTSGIDAWLKRVEYPVINKWYQKYTSGTGSYHEDTGEGLDNFHVGVSRGVGGIAIKKDAEYHVSKNFISYKTIANGPIRTLFELVYAPYTINGKTIEETKRISLDYGQNLSKFTIKMSGSKTFSAGLTLHDNLGETTTNRNEGWMSYWEPHEDSELGQGIVIKNINQLKDFDKYISTEKDKSNLFMQISLNNALGEYYAGFGWLKSKQFNSKQDWEGYLSRFSKSLQNPLVVEIKK